VLRFDDGARRLEIGVHDLLEVGPRSGHLQLQVAWSARQRLRAGQEAHTAWQRGRAAEAAGAFRAEVVLQHTLVVRGWEVRIQGRVDGLSEEGDRLVVEELKSSTLPADRLQALTLDQLPDWALQVRLYLWFLACARREAVGRLILVSLLDGAQRVLHVAPDPGLKAWVEGRLDWLLHEREALLAWRARRRAHPVPDPHAAWRPGQRELSEAVSDALRRGQQLLLSAPTGYGKTAAALHGALVVARDTGQRVFFATARGTQQQMAEATARALVAAGLPLRCVSLRAREKVCLNDVVACRADACRYAAGYHDKVEAGDLLRRAWSSSGIPGVEGVVALGREAEACPFALSIDLLRGADLVIGDLNYALDPSVRLAEILDDPREWLLIVDEAHNLPDRAMDWGSPGLRIAEADAAIDALPPGDAARPFRELAEDLGQWLRAGVALVPRLADEGAWAAPPAEAVDRAGLEALAARFEALALDHALLRAADPRPGPDPWIDAARAVSRLRAALQRAGPETLAVWRRADPGQVGLFARGGAAGLRLLCRDPAPLLGPALGALGGVLLMSATLQPADYYLSVLGLDPKRAVVRAEPSPFPPERRAVLICPQVSTAFRHRARDEAATAALLTEALAAVPGNAAVFFPSFAVMERLLPQIALGGRAALVQGRQADEAARAAVLDTLREGAGHVLMAVLGGVFSEGVDLPGAALRAVLVLGPGLPQLSLERREIEAWHEGRSGQGERYAWLVPGMCRVVQAAGRVVRSPEDRGAVVLICQRFLRRDLQALMPPDWGPRRCADPGAALRAFFAADPPAPPPDTHLSRSGERPPPDRGAAGHLG
jgi:DNA excision repair protein ERCC-2